MMDEYGRLLDGKMLDGFDGCWMGVCCLTTGSILDESKVRPVCCCTGCWERAKDAHHRQQPKPSLAGTLLHKSR